VTYQRHEIVKVPFPFTDQHSAKVRPALVLSDSANFNGIIGHSVLAMITSAKHSAWPLDVPIIDLGATGLSAPSIVRMKLFTLDHRLILARLGKLADVDRANIEHALHRLLGYPT